MCLCTIALSNVGLIQYSSWPLGSQCLGTLVIIGQEKAVGYVCAEWDKLER